MPKKDHQATAGHRSPVYSIRAASDPDVSCAACGHRSTGCGPVGYRDDEPICDLCLLEGSTVLGMVLALISVTRAFAAISSKSPGEWLDPLRELGAFARVYECFAAKIGPSRLFRIPGFTEKDASRS